VLDNLPRRRSRSRAELLGSYVSLHASQSVGRWLAVKLVLKESRCLADARRHPCRDAWDDLNNAAPAIDALLARNLSASWLGCAKEVMIG